MRLISSTAVVVLACTVLATSSGHAQTSKGIISGVVRDTSGAVIANANISVRAEATGETRSTTTNANGEYRLDAISPDFYTVHVEATNFATQNVQHLKVLPSVVTSFNVTLNVGAIVSTVDVEANSNLINTENAQLATAVGKTELGNLPVFTLNPIELAYTAPGVQLVDQGGLSNGVTIQVNGARPRANNFLIDGQEINDPGIAGQALQPNLPDMYQGITVITNSASAEYGGAGGGIVNLITRSGSNKFHGDAWELYSGSGLNSLDGQLRQGPHVHGAKARYNQHQYGFTIGGPIIKDKLFAFGASQWSRFYGNEVAAVNLLPDSNGIAVLQGLKGQYPNAAVLLSLINNGDYLNNFTYYASQGTTTVPLGPDAQGNPRPALTLGEFQRPAVAESNPDTQWTYRVDWLPRPSDTIYVRYLHDRTNLSPDFFTNATALPGFDTIQGGTSEQFGGTWTHVFTPQLLNEFRVSELRTRFSFDFASDTQKNLLAHTPTIQFSKEYQGGNPGGMPLLGAPSGYPQGSAQDIYQFQDTVSWTKGRQTLRIGTDIGREILVNLVPFNFYGSLTYQSGGGYSDIANFLDDYLGRSGSATINLGSNRVDPHSYNQAYFAQDDVKLTPELTMNFGVRYEYRANPENSVPYPAIDPNNPFLPITTKIRVSEDRNNIAPRIGLAYAPQNGSWFGDGKTVYHAGFGIFYDSIFTNIVDNSQSSAPNIASPLATSTAGRGVSGAYEIIPTLTPVILPTNTVTSVVKNIVNPQTYQWNLGIERQLPANLKWTINYVGTRGEKLLANQQYNYFDPNTGERLHPDRGAINARGNFGDSIYHGLETDISHDFRHGIFVHASYTYSKVMDNASEVFALFNQPTSYAANLAPGGRSGEWGASAYDHTQYFSVQYVYALPSYNGNRIFSLLTKDWTISGDTTLQSGPPSTWQIYGIDTNSDGNAANDRPILANPSAPYTAVGIDGYYLGPDANTGADPITGVYYDLATNNALGTLVPVSTSQVHFLVPTQSGNVRRDSFRQPGVQYWNMALQKELPATFTHVEGAKFQFRMEAQNVGNHNNVEPLDINLLDAGTSTFLNPSVQRSSATNGSLAQGRIVRLWAKFVF